MNLIEACELIKKDFRGEPIPEGVEDSLYVNFNKILIFEDRPEILEKCILDDKNWELHLHGRFFLLYKAKAFGVSSRAFLLDYYGFLSAHIDCGEIYEDALKKIDELLQEKES